MAQLRCIIIDDERLARAELAALLTEIGDCQLVGEAADASSALPLIKELRPDLLFLDINMPGSNGFELLAQIDNPPQVVFATAYDQYAIKAFEVKALDYLLKPIRKERLIDCLKTVRHRLPSQPIFLEQLFIQKENGGYFLRLADVFLIRAYGHYVRFYHGNQSSTVYRSMKELEKQLDPDQFFRVNRSEIVQIEKIKEVRKISRGRYQLLVEGEKVVVSESKSVVWRKRFKS